MKLNRGVLLLLLVIIFAIAACGGQINDWQIYNTASDQFTTLAEQYEFYYQLQDTETKAEWKEKFDPIFIAGDEALTEWRNILNAGEDSTAQMEAFMGIKSRIILLLLELTKEG